jgi:hypothetical protein
MKPAQPVRGPAPVEAAKSVYDVGVSDYFVFDESELDPPSLALYHRWLALEKPGYNLGAGQTVVHLGKFLAHAALGHSAVLRAQLEVWLTQLEG